ncbi:MAG: hypothetical protein VR71_11525 [Roseovarius sp. BRH_c41]|uniref:LysR family transcriptional regulator n=1 Tax=Roseovarius sp. BRH_c41 TaxID=1629709 RepID=UPI0005F0F6BF|nr:LysR family transcriptional regulator [Roseovarius sp. BRH_c41]KJS43093.1 MAG: hypothetical protein VR71_11525 [Roseovarius sp. BRH_c41]
MINLRHVETFCAIIEFGTFSAAAKALFTTQPAISLRIRELESELGVKLFETSNRRPTLTIKGEYFVNRAQDLLAMARSIKEDMEGEHDPAGRIRLGAVETVAVTWLADFIQLANEKFPKVILELDIALTADVWTKFHDGMVDMILVPGPIKESNVHCEPLGNVPLTWVASRKLPLPEGPLKKQQLAQYPMISLSGASIIYQLVERWFAESNYRVNWVNHCSSLNVVSSLTAAGLGVSLLPSQMLREATKDALVELAVEPKIPALKFFVVYRKIFSSPLFTEIAKVAQQASNFSLD